MTRTPDEGVDLTPLAADAALRATRVASRLAERVGAARQEQARRRELAIGVRRRLARLALPAAMAAAVAVVLATREDRPPPPDMMAAVVMQPGPVKPWLVQRRRPQISELLAVLDRRP